MLCSAGAAATVGGRGFVAKVADFGLSRTLEIRSKMQTANYGTLSHMPPELVMHGTVSKVRRAGLQNHRARPVVQEQPAPSCSLGVYRYLFVLIYCSLLLRQPT